MREDSPPLIHICIRQTLDWHDEALVSDQIDSGFRRKFAAWNATFTMPYHVFRQRLSAITTLNFSRVEGAILSRIDDVPRGHLIVPTDDDDWFAPNLVSRLRQSHESDAAGYLWVRDVLGYSPPMVRLRAAVGRLIGRPDKHLCKTNNYAVRSEPELMPLALNHLRASAYFDLHPRDITRVPATLAIQNRNLASQTSLAFGRPTISKRKLVALLDKHRALYAAWKPSPSLRWAEPYVALMNHLMDDIDVR
jgi:hypothetical protein